LLLLSTFFIVLILMDSLLRIRSYKHTILFVQHCTLLLILKNLTNRDHGEKPVLKLIEVIVFTLSGFCQIMNRTYK
jgi:hypothetical protein